MSDNRQIERIEKALSNLGDDLAPPSGWEERVLSQASQPLPSSARASQRGHSPWWRRLALAAAPLVACAALLIVWDRIRCGAPPSPLHLAWEAEPGRVQMMGKSVHVGQNVQVTVTGGRHRALRVYRNDTELVLACPGDPRCRLTDDALSVSFQCEEIGDYRLLAVSADRLLDPPRKNFDEEMAIAKEKSGTEPKDDEFHCR